MMLQDSQNDTSYKYKEE